LPTVWKVVLGLFTGCLLAACGAAQEGDRGREREQAQENAMLRDFHQVKDACNAASSRNKAGFDDLAARCKDYDAHGRTEEQQQWCRNHGQDLLSDSQRISDVCIHAINDLERRMHDNTHGAMREADRQQADLTAREALDALGAKRRPDGETPGTVGAVPSVTVVPSTR
jgi:hypothetical protein